MLDKLRSHRRRVYLLKSARRQRYFIPREDHRSEAWVDHQWSRGAYIFEDNLGEWRHGSLQHSYFTVHHWVSLLQVQIGATLDCHTLILGLDIILPYLDFAVWVASQATWFWGNLRNIPWLKCRWWSTCRTWARTEGWSKFENWGRQKYQRSW